jgi:DNA-binding MarR family transcriptional regulator
MPRQPTPEPEAPTDAVVDLGPLPTLIGYALRRAYAVVLQDFNRALAEYDIRPAQFAVLEAVKHNPGLRQTQVSFSLGIKTTNFVPLLDELERRGLAARRPIAGDRRARGLFLTPRGQDLLAQLEKLAAEHESRFTARIGAHGKAQLLGLLHRLADPAFDAPRDGN